MFEDPCVAFLEQVIEQKDQEINKLKSSQVASDALVAGVDVFGGRRGLATRPSLPPPPAKLPFAVVSPSADGQEGSLAAAQLEMEL
jgi:hypothetical protein